MSKIGAFVKDVCESAYWFFGCLLAIVVIMFLLVPFFLGMAWEWVVKEIRYRKYGKDFGCRDIRVIPMDDLASGKVDLVVPKDEMCIW